VTVRRYRIAHSSESIGIVEAVSDPGGAYVLYKDYADLETTLTREREHYQRCVGDFAKQLRQQEATISRVDSWATFNNKNTTITADELIDLLNGDE